MVVAVVGMDCTLSQIRKLTSCSSQIDFSWITTKLRCLLVAQPLARFFLLQGRRNRGPRGPGLPLFLFVCILLRTAPHSHEQPPERAVREVRVRAVSHKLFIFVVLLCIFILLLKIKKLVIARCTHASIYDCGPPKVNHVPAPHYRFSHVANTGM